jgi:xanthine dehydrogenase accessory factor
MVVVTVANSRGSVPQNVGARMIVGRDQILFGTVGGGKLEHRCTELAQQMLTQLPSDQTKLVTWNLQTELGMSCGGEVTLLLEKFEPCEAWNIAIFGAGHVAQELVPILLRLDCELTVIDPRADWLAKLPDENHRYRKFCANNMVAALAQLPTNCFVMMMTMGHRFDFPILHQALTAHQFPYLGVIGSKAKRAKLERELREAEYRGEMSFYCPLGEDFGSNAPIEIALSIAAQLLKRKEALVLTPKNLPRG